MKATKEEQSCAMAKFAWESLQVFQEDGNFRISNYERLIISGTLTLKALRLDLKSAI